MLGTEEIEIAPDLLVHGIEPEIGLPVVNTHLPYYAHSAHQEFIAGKKCAVPRVLLFSAIVHAIVFEEGVHILVVSVIGAEEKLVLALPAPACISRSDVSSHYRVPLCAR